MAASGGRGRFAQWQIDKKRTLPASEIWPTFQLVLGLGKFVAFQPFGYRFEIKSPSRPADVKAAIRARMKGWFDPKNGARGWIAGPFVCLWFSAFDKYGPMLFGLISEDDLGTRVRGRAGSDLNGVVMFSLLTPFMAFLTFNLVSGGASVRQLLVIAVVFLVGGPLLYWSAHKDRRQAEPLVRFLRDAVTISGRSLRARSAATTISKSVTLILGENSTEAATPDAIHDALLAVGAGDFVILESGPETYIQTASRDGGYILEMREGDSQRHFQAVRRSGAPIDASGSTSIFTFEEVREAFMAYATEGPMPHFLVWERMHFGD